MLLYISQTQTVQTVPHLQKSDWISHLLGRFLFVTALDVKIHNILTFIKKKDQFPLKKKCIHIILIMYKREL